MIRNSKLKKDNHVHEDEQFMMEDDLPSEEEELLRCIDDGEIHNDLSQEMLEEAPKKLRPHQINTLQKKEQIQVSQSSEEYATFIASLCSPEIQKLGVCLSCWQYISHHQMKLHQGHGHLSVLSSKLRTEDAFLHYAQLCGKLLWDDQVVILRPYNKNEQLMKRMQLINYQSHDLKACRENKGTMRGQPPFLASPLVPFNMVPQNLSPGMIAMKVAKERGPVKEVGSKEFLAGVLAEGLTGERREKLVQVIQGMADTVDETAKRVQDIQHKVSMMLK